LKKLENLPPPDRPYTGMLWKALYGWDDGESRSDDADRADGVLQEGFE